MASANPSFGEESWDFKLPEDFDPNFSLSDLTSINEDFLNLPNIPLFEDDLPSVSVSYFIY